MFENTDQTRETKEIQSEPTKIPRAEHSDFLSGFLHLLELMVSSERRWVLVIGLCFKTDVNCSCFLLVEEREALTQGPQESVRKSHILLSAVKNLTTNKTTVLQQ